MSNIEAIIKELEEKNKTFRLSSNDKRLLFQLIWKYRETIEFYYSPLAEHEFDGRRAKEALEWVPDE